MGKKGSVHRTLGEMQQVVEDWSVSGESRPKYCARTGVALHVLNYWIGRLRQVRPEARFQEVKAPVSASPGVYMRLTYPDGRVLEFTREESLEHLRTVLSW